MREHLSRFDWRNVLAGVIVVFVVGGGTAALLATPDSAQAQTSMTLDISDVTFQTDNGTIQTPYVDVQANYEYTVLETPTEVVVSLEVGNTEVDSGTMSNIPTSDTGTLPLTGPVTDSAMFTESDFNVSLGQTKTVTVPVTLRAEVIRDGSVVVSDETSQDVAVTVEHTSDGTIVVGGTGEIVAGEP